MSRCAPDQRRAAEDRVHRRAAGAPRRLLAQIDPLPTSGAPANARQPAPGSGAVGGCQAGPDALRESGQRRLDCRAAAGYAARVGRPVPRTIESDEGQINTAKVNWSTRNVVPIAGASACAVDQGTTSRRATPTDRGDQPAAADHVIFPIPEDNVPQLLRQPQAARRSKSRRMTAPTAQARRRTCSASTMNRRHHRR